MRERAQHYTATAIVLHWAIALAIICNILLGWWMHRAIDAPDTQARAIAAFQMHKSIGLTILALSAVRLGWRLLNPPPPLSDAMPAWERFGAKATHWAFYLLLVAIPLSGWLYVSTGWRGEVPLNVPTLWFGLVEVPHLFGLNEKAPGMREALSGGLLETHELLVWATVALLALHVAAALKHHFVNRDAVFAQMFPLVTARGDPASPPRDPRRAAALIGAAILSALAIGAVALSLAQIPAATVAIATAADHGAETARAPSQLPETTVVLAEPSTASVGSAPLAVWTVDPAGSEIAFSGMHAGALFRGRFERWRADIHFDAAQLAQSRASVTIDTASATDGVALHDKTLPQAEWFDVANHPTASFRTRSIRHRGGDRYEADGILTIKGRDAPVPLAFTLVIARDRAVMTGRAAVDRSVAGLGMLSDPNASWVSRTIAIDVRVVARRKS